MNELTGKVALVTGGTRGIGKAIAISLANAGANVVVSGRDGEAAAAVATEVRKIAGRGGSVTADLLDDDAVDTLVPKTVAQAGGLDILVNNAGIDIEQKAIDYRLEDWRKILRINLEVPFRLSQAAGRIFLKQKRGKIINIASALGVVGGPEECGYAASKHGLIGMSKVLAVEWARKGVQVNVIAPGLIRTDMARYVLDQPGMEDVVSRMTPAGRVGEPHDIGAVAAFLASDASDFMHGHVVVVDGGWTIQ